MANSVRQREQTIEFAPVRRGNRQSTALTKGARKMLGIEQRKLLGIAITTHIANAGIHGMGQIEQTMVEEFAEGLQHNEEIWHASKGMEFRPYLYAFLKDVMLQRGGMFQTLYDVAGEGITDLVDGSIYVDELETWWQRFFGGD